MTKIESLLQKREISLYLLCKQVGLDPVKELSNFSKKIRGETTVSVEELEKVQEALTNLGVHEQVENYINAKRFEFV